MHGFRKSGLLRQRLAESNPRSLFADMRLCVVCVCLAFSLIKKSTGILPGRQIATLFSVTIRVLYY